ncbi:uncharacterized protein LOC108670071 isoform X2 [Hyalella azteca]|uniref:Uncharacterized protein LOC108670071 isoform X2 n=1 Tax=Hyalella azteca TaxID=294128 RepID=A0A8B7NHA3_HYAAZ|nr:uncharacterized protein LOC108670071 isoform X2 [Hyalella azteca]
MKILIHLFYGTFFIIASTQGWKGVEGADDFRDLTGYADLGLSGIHHQFTKYTPDLSAVQMDNTIESSCGTGLWLLYDATNYALDSSAVCLWHAVNYCSNWAAYCQNMVSSVRYAGSPHGLNNDYYNLYEGTSFRGDEFRGDEDAAQLGDLDLAVSSLIVTGQAAWTFYTGLDFTGATVCVYADETNTNSGIDLDFARIENLSELGLPDNSIRSVARGCFSERVVGAAPRSHAGEEHVHDAN